MNWTHNKPTECGYYWYKNGNCNWIVKLEHKDDADEFSELVILTMNDARVCGFDTPWFANPSGLWYGPIEPPPKV